MRRKPAALRNIAIDRDARALDGFECDYPVELTHGCAHRFLSEYALEGSELIYRDPPYLRRTRTSKQRYRFDYEEADHVELLELLKGLRCQVMVSGYGSALYEERLAGWRRVELQVMNHAGVRTECVWMNFAPDATAPSSPKGRESFHPSHLAKTASAAKWPSPMPIICGSG